MLEEEIFSNVRGHVHRIRPNKSFVFCDVVFEGDQNTVQVILETDKTSGFDAIVHASLVNGALIQVTDDTSLRYRA
jgi:aspartyl/asparaginyl-tRNA synthetase